MKRPRVSDTLSLQASYHRLGTVKYLHHWEEVPLRLNIGDHNSQPGQENSIPVPSFQPPFASATITLAKLNPTS
jgi:hypothetical protein